MGRCGASALRASRSAASPASSLGTKATTWNPVALTESVLPKRGDDNDSYHRWRNVSTMGFSVGTITLGTGVLLVLTSPSEGQETDTAKVEPWVGLGSAGVRGGF